MRDRPKTKPRGLAVNEYSWSPRVNRLERLVTALRFELTEVRQERDALSLLAGSVTGASLNAQAVGHIACVEPELTHIMGLAKPDGTVTELFGPVDVFVGDKANAFIGRSAFDNVHPEDLDRIHQLVERSLANPYLMCVGELRLRHRDGHWTSVETTIVNLRDAASIGALLFSTRDITDRKNIEQEKTALEAQLNQARKLEAVGRLAGGVAHDFNNLLTAIVGNVELARTEAELQDTVRENLDEVAKAARRATELTKQLLAFSRHQYVEPKDISVNQLLTGLERLLRRVIREDIELRLRLSAEADCVRADPGQLEQVIVNLVVNARDAMPTGGVIAIETVVTELDDTFHCCSLDVPPGRYLTIAVSDTGPGIPVDVRPHIFEPFFTTKSADGGTGLGLATVYGIVKQANGGITVYSEVGFGTTLRVYFPISSGGAPTLVTESAWPEPLREVSETVLLVEDDASVRGVAIKFLERLGYKMHAFSSGLDALDFVKNNPRTGHVLLTDVVMPKMNGRELAEAVHAIDPSKRIIFASGYAEALFAQRTAASFPFAFLEKPYSIKRLARKLREAIDRVL